VGKAGRDGGLRHLCSGVSRKIRSQIVLRPLIQRLFTYESFSKFLERYAAPILRLRWRLKPFSSRQEQAAFDFILPVYDYKGYHRLNDHQLIEWGKLDTLDAFFACYDNPMTCEEVLAALRDMGAPVLSADRKLNFFRTTVSSPVPDSSLRLLPSDGMRN